MVISSSDPYHGGKPIPISLLWFTLENVKLSDAFTDVHELQKRLKEQDVESMSRAATAHIFETRYHKESHYAKPQTAKRFARIL